MRSLSETLSLLTTPGVIPVIRTSKRAQVLPVCEALVAGGLRVLEITLTIPDALSVLAEVVAKFDGRACVGAGSILNAAQAREAIAVGAEFLVTPITRAEVADAAHAAGRPVMIGAFTPTEAQLAHEAGADLIKIFPADTLGPAYFKSLLAPMPHLRLVPTGGVTLRNLADFFKAGCPAVGVGSSLLSKELIDAGNWRELSCRAGEFLQAALHARGK
ncbi:MAG: bifunctional 4-hydroxy-2-oxoglutarate aldolase/2-dehydro-3-deoxy-phosphogluconate aldolase [Verrucomicrobia bacterium]|nr:bifunctional 4-hydroxy-2-oxoglutarate aldolase/2-dehydro-3-deoxy-phosphogluconate aldolase [Verrucomicrobiota bacterium]